MKPGVSRASPVNPSSMPAMIRSSEDLPAPFAPSTPILAPGIERERDVLQHRAIGRVEPTELVGRVDELRRHGGPTPTPMAWRPRSPWRRGATFRTACTRSERGLRAETCFAVRAWPSFRWLHIIVPASRGSGCSYYFNLVQVPAFAAYETRPRPQRSRSRSWPAGALVVPLGGGGDGAHRHPDRSERRQDYFANDFGKRANGISISTGMLIGLIMFVNVWGVIWRNQKIGAGQCGTGARWRRAAARGGGRRSRALHGVSSERGVLGVDGVVHDVHVALRRSATTRRAVGPGPCTGCSRSSSLAVLELNALGIIGAASSRRPSRRRTGRTRPCRTC